MMRRMFEFHLPGALALLAFAPPGAVIAADSAKNPPPALVDSAPADKAGLGTNELPVIGLVAHASKLIGQKVLDQDDNSIGELKDLLIEFPGGEVHAGVVSSGRKEFAVPARAFFPAGEGRVVFNGDKKLFEGSPEFKTEAKGSLPKNLLLETFKHFGHKPPDPATGSRELQPVTKVIGQALLTPVGDTLGKITDVVMEISQGRTLYVLIGPANRNPQPSFPVPPHLFEFSTNSTALTFTGTVEQLAEAPKIPSQFPMQTAVPEFAASVYRHYGVPFTGPTERADSDSPTQTQAHPALSPTGRTDAEIRQGFLKAITADAAMPASEAQNLNIQVQNGRITLSGNVKREAHKQALLSAAQQAAGPTNVIDNVTVR